MTNWYEPYDSPEEAYVSWFLDELVEGGYVKEYVSQPPATVLSIKKRYRWVKRLKTKEKDMYGTLLQEHVYTPDFKVLWRKGIGVFYKDIIDIGSDKDAPFCVKRFVWGDGDTSIWEVKPLFDRNNMTRLFTINQKWMYDKYGIYVQKIIPQKLFEATFTPKKYLLTDMGKQKRKLTFAPRTLEEYVKSRE